MPDLPRWRRSEDAVRTAILQLPVGTLIDRLARVGVRVDLATFLVHAARYDSVAELARAGFELDSRMSRDEAWAATCAIEALWRRWTPSTGYIEQVVDAWFDLDDRLGSLETSAAVAGVLAVVALGDTIGGARRLVREGFAGVAADVIAAALRRPEPLGADLGGALIRAADGFLAVMPVDERWRSLSDARHRR